MSISIPPRTKKHVPSARDYAEEFAPKRGWKFCDWGFLDGEAWCAIERTSTEAANQCPVVLQGRIAAFWLALYHFKGDYSNGAA